MRQQTIERYLERYAEPLCHQLPHPNQLLEQTENRVIAYDQVLVIPAFDEPVGCLDHVLPSTLQRTLVIVVVNAAEDSDRAAIERTQRFWHSFQKGDSDRSIKTASADSATLNRYRIIPHNPDTTVLVVDCCTEGHQLPCNQGVGLARKIGGDIALTYMAQSIVNSDWIHYTDADVVLPDDFFPMDLAAYLQESASPQTQQDDISVVLYPFRHQPPHHHILLYELSLRYYVTELAAARSPYAFHTIGSLMCVNGLHYAKVRGFPKRKAAEDFYMLNKLAKTGAIVQIHEPIVQLDSRLSHRVPFGTGAMMTKLAQADEFLFYHPAVFQHLREWMECIEALWPPIYEEKDSSPCPSIKSRGWLQTWFLESPWQGACWLDCLVDMGLEKTLKQAYRQNRDRQHFRFYMWTWFDAFRTLKFVHYLRDKHYPSLAVEEWVPLMNHEKSWVGDTSYTKELTKIDIKQLEPINQFLCDLEQKLEPLVGPTVSSSN